MDRFRRIFSWTCRSRAEAIELAGVVLATLGIHQVYPPAAFIFAGAALMFIAQGVERQE